MLDVAGVADAGRLEEEHLHLLFGHRPVLDAVRHNEKLARAKLDGAVAELHPEPPADHQKQLILRLVLVPDEFALELDELDLLAVQDPHDLGAPVLVDLRELVCQADLVHGGSYSRQGRSGDRAGETRSDPIP